MVHPWWGGGSVAIRYCTEYVPDTIVHAVLCSGTFEVSGGIGALGSVGAGGQCGVHALPHFPM